MHGDFTSSLAFFTCSVLFADYRTRRFPVKGQEVHGVRDRIKMMRILDFESLLNNRRGNNGDYPPLRNI